MKFLNDHVSELAGKKVIVRANVDVPIENGEVQDTTRIEANVATIKALRGVAASVIVIAHQDRPDGRYKAEASLAPVASLLEKFLGEPVALVGYQENYSSMSIPTSPVVMLENLRFWAQEEANDENFGKYLASLGEAYVNEAFANCHREHASVVGIPKYLPSYAGIVLSKEMQALEKVLNNPQQPLVVVIGGAKLETKEPLVKVFADKADAILVGGKIAVDLLAKGEQLPSNVHVAALEQHQKDITIQSAEEFAAIIKAAGTVLWNGTMGISEEPEYAKGTQIVGQAINDTPAFTLAGGGDTETALTQFNLEAGIDHISTGGGAMLEYLSSGSLPALSALG